MPIDKTTYWIKGFFPFHIFALLSPFKSWYLNIAVSVIWFYNKDKSFWYKTIYTYISYLSSQILLILKTLNFVRSINRICSCYHHTANARAHAPRSAPRGRPTFQQAVVVVLGAEVGQAPPAPEDGSVPAPVVAVEPCEQLTACGEQQGEEWALAAGSGGSAYTAVPRTAPRSAMNTTAGH